MNIVHLVQSTRVDFSSRWIIRHPTLKRVTYFYQVISMDCLTGDQELSSNTPNRDWNQENLCVYRLKIARRLKWSEGSRIKIYFWTRRSVTDQGVSARSPYKYTSDTVRNSPRFRQPWSRCEDFHAEIKHRSHLNHGQVFH